MCQGCRWRGLAVGGSTGTPFTVPLALYAILTLTEKRDLEDGGRGESVEKMQRLKWGREREKLD